MKAFTVKQLIDICAKHRYILARTVWNDYVGMNCRIAPIAIRLRKKKDEDETSVISYIPCGLNEYINYKGSFEYK